jgi:hypothetical protein
VSADENEFREWWQNQAGLKDCHEEVADIVKSSLRAAAYEGWFEGHKHTELTQPDVTVVTVLYDALRSAITWLAQAEAMPVKGFAHSPLVEYLRSVLDGVDNPHNAVEETSRHPRCEFADDIGNGIWPKCKWPATRIVAVQTTGKLWHSCVGHAGMWASSLAKWHGLQNVVVLNLNPVANKPVDDDQTVVVPAPKPIERLCKYLASTGFCNQPASHLIIINVHGGDARPACERHAAPWASTLSVSYGASHVFTIKIDA